MPMSEFDARQKADNIIFELIKHQPQLIHPQAPSEAHGAKVAEFIAGLRKGLTEMFKTQS